MTTDDNIAFKLMVSQMHVMQVLSLGSDLSSATLHPQPFLPSIHLPPTVLPPFTEILWLWTVHRLLQLSKAFAQWGQEGTVEYMEWQEQG